MSILIHDINLCLIRPRTDLLCFLLRLCNHGCFPWYRSTCSRHCPANRDPNRNQMVVGMRTSLCTFQHGFESFHRHHAVTSYSKPNPPMDHLDLSRRHRNLRSFLLLLVRPPMSTFELFLDAVHRRQGQMH